MVGGLQRVKNTMARQGQKVSRLILWLATLRFMHNGKWMKLMLTIRLLRLKRFRIRISTTTPEEVPYSYFDNDYPSLLAEYGGDYEAAALATAANGHNKVWECFVAGISPTNATSVFTAKINMVDGAPVVSWEPDLNTSGVIRAYKVYGKETLEGGGEWQYPTNSLHRFFKVTVEMP